MMVAKNDIEMYSSHHEVKFVIAEKYIKTLKNKIYKYKLFTNTVSKNVYIDKLDDIVNKCNNTYHSTDKVKPVVGKPGTYIDFSEEIIYQGLYLKLLVLLEFQNIKIALQRTMFRIGLKKFL